MATTINGFTSQFRVRVGLQAVIGKIEIARVNSNTLEIVHREQKVYKIVSFTPAIGRRGNDVVLEETGWTVGDLNPYDLGSLTVVSI